MNKNDFMLLMAALGGYAAWLTIQEKRKEKAASDWLTEGAFKSGNFDFYGQKMPEPKKQFSIFEWFA